MAAAELASMEQPLHGRKPAHGHHKKRKEVPVVTEPGEDEPVAHQEEARTVTFADEHVAAHPQKRKKTPANGGGKKNARQGIAIEAEREEAPASLEETLSEPERPRRLHPDEVPDDDGDDGDEQTTSEIGSHYVIHPPRADQPEEEEEEAAPYVPPYAKKPLPAELSAILQSDPAPSSSGPSRLLDFSRAKPAGKNAGAQLVADTRHVNQGDYWWAAEPRSIDQMPPASPRWDSGGPGVFYVHGQHARALAVARDAQEAQELLEHEIGLWGQEAECAVVRLDVAKPMRAVLCARHLHLPEEDQRQLETFMTGGGVARDEELSDVLDSLSPQQQTAEEARTRQGTQGRTPAPGSLNSLSVYYVNDRFSGICVARNVKVRALATAQIFPHHVPTQSQDAIAAFDDDRAYCAEPPCSLRPYRVNRLELEGVSPFALFLCNCRRG